MLGFLCYFWILLIYFVLAYKLQPFPRELIENADFIISILGCFHDVAFLLASPPVRTGLDVSRIQARLWPTSLSTDLPTRCSTARMKPGLVYRLSKL
jgi:hypothetical protein